MYVIMQSVPFSQRLFHKNICLAGWLTLPTFYRRIGKVFTVHEYKDVFLFDISLLLGGGQDRKRRYEGPTCPLRSIIGVDIVQSMTCLRLIRQRIFVTPIAIPWRNFCTQLQIFFYRGESERACYDTPLIRRFCSAAFPVRNGRRYFIYEKSRVLSFSHTILLPDHGFPCVSLRHCSPSTVSKYQQGSCSDIFLSKFPDRSTRMHRFLGITENGNDLMSHSFEISYILVNQTRARWFV